MPRGDWDTAAMDEAHDLMALVRSDFQRRLKSRPSSKPMEVVAGVLELLDLIDFGIQSGSLSSNEGTSSILAYMKSVADADAACQNYIPPATSSAFTSTAPIPPSAPTTAEPLPSTPPRALPLSPGSSELARPPILLAANAAYAAYTSNALDLNMDLPPLPAYSRSPPPWSPQPLQPVTRPLPQPPVQAPRSQAQMVANNEWSLPQHVSGLFLDQEQPSSESDTLLQSTLQTGTSAPTSNSVQPNPRRSQLTGPRQAQQTPGTHRTTGVWYPPPPLPSSACNSGLAPGASSRPSSPTPSSRPHQHDCEPLGYTGSASSLRQRHPDAPAPPLPRTREYTAYIPTESDDWEGEVTKFTLRHRGAFHEHYATERPLSESCYTDSTSLTGVRSNNSDFKETTRWWRAEGPAYTTSLAPLDEEDVLGYEDRRRRSPEREPPHPESRSWNPALAPSPSPSPSPSPPPSPSLPPAAPQPKTCYYPNRPQTNGAVYWDNMPADLGMDKPSTPRAFRKLKKGARKIGGLFCREQNNKNVEAVWADEDVVVVDEDEVVADDDEVVADEDEVVVDEDEVVVDEDTLPPRLEEERGETAPQNVTIHIFNYLFLDHHEGMHKYFPNVMGGFAKQMLPCCVVARKIRAAYKDHRILENLVQSSQAVGSVTVPRSPRRRRRAEQT